MDSHTHNLSLLCLLCAGKLHRQYSGKPACIYLVKDHTIDIARCFGLDTREDSEEIHPSHFCNLRKSKLSKGVVSSASSSACQSISWIPHTERDCKTCALVEEIAKGGRPKKKKTTVFCQNQTASPTPVPQDIGVDMDKDVYFSKTCSSFKYEKALTTARFIDSLTPLTCDICGHIVDRPIESPCCEHLFCAECAYQKLQNTNKCAHCNEEISLSKLKAPHSLILSCLKVLKIKCDYAGDNRLLGCPDVVTLSSLRDHCTSCSHANSSDVCIHPTSQSTTVGDVLLAPAVIAG